MTGPNADKQIAQAKAEQRRAMAVARSQEMKALVVQARAKQVEAEAEVPKALADALNTGRFSVMDYYEMQNKYNSRYENERNYCRTEPGKTGNSIEKGDGSKWVFL